MRVRTKKHEIMIAPGEYAYEATWPVLIDIMAIDREYLLIVVQNPQESIQQ